jgi:RNA recognition motif-containing protein
MTVRLFVGNLPYHVTEAELREHFSAIGPISYLSLPTDRETGQPRGFAFVEFNDRAQAEEAIRRFDNQSFKGRPLAVSEARARDNRPRASIPTSRPTSPAEPYAAPPPTSGSKPSRNFGPDASPQRSRSKAKGGPKSERVSKGPMREVVRGQFFGADDDEDDDEESGEENSALLSDTEREKDV